MRLSVVKGFSLSIRIECHAAAWIGRSFVSFHFADTADSDYDPVVGDVLETIKFINVGDLLKELCFGVRSQRTRSRSGNLKMEVS